MSCSINADNGVISGITGIRTTADNTGNLALQSNGVTLLTATTANTLSVSNVATLSISGATSGAVALAVPAVAGTNTVTIAAQTGTLNAAGPAFNAYLTATQNVSASTFTKVQLNAELFDTNNNFDSTTNYRFTPTVAGYYFFQGSFIAQQVSGTGSVALAAIYKNGTNISQNELTSTFSSGLTMQTSILAYMNGTTDYVELYAYTNASVTPSLAPGSNTTWFNGYLVRGA
jgi:hypothetical protein